MLLQVTKPQRKAAREEARNKVCTKQSENNSQNVNSKFFLLFSHPVVSDTLRPHELPGFPVPHHLPDFAQVHCIGDAI